MGTGEACCSGKEDETQARRPMLAVCTHLYYELLGPKQHCSCKAPRPGRRPQPEPATVSDLPQHLVRRLHSDASALQHPHEPDPAALALHRYCHASLGHDIDVVGCCQWIFRHGGDSFLPWVRRSGLPAWSAFDPE